MSHALLILKINTTFENVSMVLKLFFDISTSFRFSKISVECTLHSEAPPWPRTATAVLALTYLSTYLCMSMHLLLVSVLSVHIWWWLYCCYFTFKLWSRFKFFIDTPSTVFDDWNGTLSKAQETSQKYYTANTYSGKTVEVQWNHCDFEKI